MKLYLLVTYEPKKKKSNREYFELNNQGNIIIQNL